MVNNDSKNSEYLNKDNYNKINESSKNSNKKFILKDKDFLILKELIEDGRKSASSISKKIDLGREIVNYRIKRLIKENLIVKFVPKINDAGFYNEYIVFLKLKLTDPVSKKDFIKDKIGDRYLIWFIKNKTGWDALIKVYSHSFDEFKRKLEEILILFNEYLSNYYTIISSKDIKENEKGAMIEKVFHKKIKKDYKTIKEMNFEVDFDIYLDKKDFKIIEMLQKDARIKYTEIADKLDLSPDSIKYRIDKMIENKVLLGFYPIINFSKLGMLYYASVLKLKDIDLDEEEFLFDFLKKSQYVIKAIKSLNTLEYFFNCLFSSEDEFDKFKEDINKKFSTNIERFEFFLLD